MELKNKVRRVGTFTFGLVLVAFGSLMLLSMLWPSWDFNWVLKASPVILISLGIEILLAARGSGKILYDWVGMLLCFLLVSAALGLYSVVWCLTHGFEL